MVSDDHDYFAWAKSGRFAVVVGALSVFCMIVALIPAIDAGATGAIVIFCVLLLIGVFNIVRGVQQLRARRG